MVHASMGLDALVPQAFGLIIEIMIIGGILVLASTFLFTFYWERQRVRRSDRTILDGEREAENIS